GRIVDNDKVLGHKILTGEYQFYAEINVNGMEDNLGEITGKTVSNTVKVTVDRETVKITSDKATVIRNNGFSVKVDGTPRALYAVWFTGVSGYNYKEVPAFIKDQEDVTSMSYLQAERTEYKPSHTKIADDLPEGVTEEGDFTGNYAVVAKLAADGSINIGIMTNENTKDTSFTIRAQRIKYLDEPLSPEEYYELDMQLYDTVKIKVEKGAVTVSASGDGSYYLGEEVTLSGTNTDSDDVYLFITGPNLPVAGGKLDAPKTNPTSKDNTRVTVKTDDTWEYKWDTSGSILDAGTYTIYATSDFALKSGINKTLSDVKYDTVSVVIKKPFVTATTSSSTVAKGDKLYIRGTAEGQPTQGVAVWILGKNYWNGEKTNLMESSMVTETVNDDGSFEYELGSADTKDLASGQYFVVVQHPMYNGVFDVKSQKNEDAKTIQVITNPKGAEDVYGVAFIVAGNGKLQGSDAAEALITAINSANVDDTYTKLTFLVEEPWIRVNSVGDHYIGDRFKITGTTNLAVGDTLIVEVTSSSFQPTQKTQSGEFSGVSSTVKVNEGSTYNEWALDVDASTFKADEYIVNVEAIEADVTTTTTFNILAGTPATAPASSSTTAPASLPTGAPATAPSPAATTAPGFGALIALIGLGAAGTLFSFRVKRIL
ncbi:MAG: PGF-CTERM sorting domain-containing protein, partial [Methanomicrobium sp.]|nr:PGF-CTERM sorting domain-containing protein [Methanomicrobium sp.]